MTHVVFLSLLVCVFVGALTLLLPELSPGRFWFAITVPPGFRATPEGLAALRRYHQEVAVAILVSAVAVALLAPVSPNPAIMLAFLAPFAGGMAAFLRARNQVRREAPRVPDVREAELAPGGHVPRWFLLAIPPFASPIASALYLRSRWDEIPARIPTHFSFHGPDRWADKSPQSVYAPLLVSAGLMLMFLLLMLATFYGARRTPQSSAIRKLLLAAIYLFALPFGGVGFNPLFQIPILWHFLPPLALELLAIVWAFRLARDPRAPGEATPDACWYLGSIYCNPGDPAVFVQKRMGLGYTFNFGNRWTWIVLGGFVAGITVFVRAFPRGH